MISKMVKSTLMTVMLVSSMALTMPVQAQSLDINKILRSVNNATAQDRRENSTRENRFKKALSSERGKLKSAKNQRISEERTGKQLEAKIESNEGDIVKLQEDLSRELGDLKELFGVIQQTASESQEDYKTSLISAHHPERSEDLRLMVEKMASLTELVSIDEIEQLWVELQNEMTEQSKIVTFNAPVNFVTGYEEDENGKEFALYEPSDRQVTRLGVFNAVSGNDIVNYDNELGLVALPQQMRGEFLGLSNALQSANSGISTFLLDPTKGALLAAYSGKPTIQDKINEGGIIGYIIIALGLFGAVIFLFKLLVLLGVESKVNKQARDIKRPSLRNPLGRVVKVYQDNQASDPESMELKLGEAILKESPKLNSWILFVKIIAVVAPLLGLLGTVTGMIQTFQAITLFGAGDPQTMAGGISKALVTTVLGLCVAIPTVFFHWVISNRAKRIEEVLDEHATGLVADKYEA